VPLLSVFEEVGGHRKKIEAAGRAAEREIVQLTHKRFARLEHRPIGWEEVCA
jgi:hypothetical protein